MIALISNRKYNKDDGWIVFRTRFLGKFAQRFDLKWFPFDKQSLNVIVSTKKTLDALEFKKPVQKGKGDIVCSDKGSVNIICQ